MSSRGRLLISRIIAVMLAAVCAWGLAVAEEPAETEIRFQASSGQSAWVGQGIDLHLELWSEALSFSGQGWVLPEVSGAILMQNDSGGLNMSERRQGTSWQGVRYSFQLYPQRSGELTVPSFTVRFETRDGYGSEPRAWSFDTPELKLESRLPPGANREDLLLTTDSFSMKVDWSVPTSQENALELNVGEALRLTVEREANGVPGMVFSPLEVPEIAGLGIYPNAPSVLDRNYRGTLTGTRRDVITFICEKAGAYRLPGQKFTWWDPDRNELNEEVIPALDLLVAEHPAWSSAGNKGGNERGRAFDPVNTAAWLALLILFAVVAWKGYKPLSAVFARLRKERLASEEWAFRQVRKACSGGTNALEAYSTINTWLQRFRPGMTQLQLADRACDSDLAQQILDLQEGAASGNTSDWRGKALYQSLHSWREKELKQKSQEHGLPPLNPGSLTES